MFRTFEVDVLVCRWCGDFGGVLQVDACSAYDAFFTSGQMTEAGCMAHCRRRFIDAGE